MAVLFAPVALVKGHLKTERGVVAGGSVVFECTLAGGGILGAGRVA